MNDLMDRTIGQEGSKDHLRLQLGLHSKSYTRYRIKYKPRYKQTQTYTKK